RKERRLLRPISDPHGRNAPVDADHETMSGKTALTCGRRSGHRRRQQDRATETGRDEAFDGSPDPSLQALYRGLPRPGGVGVCGRRSAERRVRCLSGRRRHQQAVQVQDPRARLRASTGHGLPLPRPHARRRVRHSWVDRYCVRRGGPMSVRRLAPPEMQPKDFSFDKANLAWAKKEITKYPEGRQQSAIVPLLWRAQEQHGGWLPEAAIRHVSDFLGMAHIRALEVATFYTMFNLRPVGKFHVQLCGTTPCRLRGADDLAKVCRKRSGGQGAVAKGGQVSWVEGECLGACGNRRRAETNYDYYEGLTAERLGPIRDHLAAGKKVKPGPQIDRQLSAPIG